MITFVEVGRRMLPKRLVAASNVTTTQTQTKVNPLHPHLEAFLASLRSSRLYGPNEIEMSALYWHGLLCI